MTLTADMIPGYRAGTWKVDLAHAEIAFSVRHLAISKVRGKFERFDATVVAAENPADSTAHVSIEVASINTGNETRDNHLRTNDFFSASEFPTIEFRSTGLRHEDGDFLLDGELTMKGVTKPITIRGEFGGIVTDHSGAVKAAAAGTAKINRSEFGVTWNAPLETGGMLLGEDVTLSIEAQFELQQDA